MNAYNFIALTAALFVAASVSGAPFGFAETVPVRAGGDLQAALDRAGPGDTITLEAGATFVGNFVLRPRPGSQLITLRTALSDEDVPTATRITPELAGPLAKLRSPNTVAVMRTAPGAHHWRLQLLEFQANAGGNGTIIELGDGSVNQNSLSQVPHDISIDRCYIHGDQDKGQKRGIGLNSAATTIRGSYISNIKGVGLDTQAIAGWNGPGPFTIENNYIEAAGENFLLGGAEPGIPDLVPSDVVFRGNHVTRPEAWRDERWQVKNLFELKNARRVLIEGNIFERHWAGAQSGYAILLTPRGEHGRAAWAVVEDVTFQFNIMRDISAAFNILGHDDAGPSGLARRIRIVNNLFYNIDRKRWGGSGHFLLIGDGPMQIVVDHNTIIQSGNVISAYGGSSSDPTPTRDFTFTNNLTLHNTYGVHGQGRAVGQDTLDVFFPDGVFARNVLAGGRTTRYPAGNEFPDEAQFARQFVDFARQDYRLVAGSPYRAAGMDGRDLGADITGVCPPPSSQDPIQSPAQRARRRRAPPAAPKSGPPEGAVDRTGRDCAGRSWPRGSTDR